MGVRDIHGSLMVKKPRLLDRGTFEGLVYFKFYKDAVEYAGECVHCHSAVGGLLRIEEPRLQMHVKPPALETALKQKCGEIMRLRHECNVRHEGKMDVQDFYKNMGLPQ